MPAIVRNPFTEEDDRLMWAFLVERLKDGDDRAFKPKGNGIWKAYAVRPGVHRTYLNLQSHFTRQMEKNIHRADVPLNDLVYLFRRLKIKIQPFQVRYIEQKFGCRIRIDRHSLPADPPEYNSSVQGAHMGGAGSADGAQEGQSDSDRTESPRSSPSPVRPPPVDERGWYGGASRNTRTSGQHEVSVPLVLRRSRRRMIVDRDEDEAMDVDQAEPSPSINPNLTAPDVQPTVLHAPHSPVLASPEGPQQPSHDQDAPHSPVLASPEGPQQPSHDQNPQRVLRDASSQTEWRVVILPDLCEMIAEPTVDAPLSSRIVEELFGEALDRLQEKPMGAVQKAALRKTLMMIKENL